jgi:hypothetical protein
MAIKWPLANGVWSNAANWNDGTLPDVGDDVHADGKTVTIDQDVQVLSIRTTQREGGTAGGNFSITSGNWNITSDIICGTSTCLTINSLTSIISIIGNITASSTSLLPDAVRLSNFLIINIIGNITGGSGTSNGSKGVNELTSLANSVINVIGNINTGSGSAVGSVGFNKASLSTLNHTGIITSFGGSTNSVGINAIRGVCNLDLIIGGPFFVGLSCSTTTTPFPTVYVNKAVGSETNLAIVGVINTSLLAKVVVKEVGVSSINGWGVLGNILFANTLTTIKGFRENGNEIILQDFENLPDQLPLESDVREGTLYNLDQKTGTLAVPDPSNVRKDVPTDNTVGTVGLTVEDLFNEIENGSNPIAIRLRNVATVESVADQFVVFTT